MSGEGSTTATDDESSDDDRSGEPTSHGSSTWKVLGEIDAPDGTGVLGHNTATSGPAVGVEGVSDAPEGYGLRTPDDANIDGTVDTTTQWRVDVDGSRSFRITSPTQFVVDGTSVTAGESVVFGKFNSIDAADDAPTETAAGAVVSGGGTVNNDTGETAGNAVRYNYGTISGGFGNEAGFAVAIGGGIQNSAINAWSTISGGVDNTIGGEAASIGGGAQNVASGDWSTVPGGAEAAATQHGQVALANGSFNEAGDAQSSTYRLRNTTTTGGESVTLFLDGESRHLTVETDRSLAFDVQVVARSTTGKTGSWHFRGAIENVADTVQIVGTTDQTSSVDADLGTVAVSADDANNALVVVATADAANGDQTVWVATARTTETKLPETTVS